MSGSIDLNCDLGETNPPYRPGSDDEILSAVTSVNIACGFHAGGPAVMRGTARAAIARGVAIGAHPGLADREGFGRRPMKLAPAEVYELVLYQLGALEAMVRGEGGKLRHVKPHGALYHMVSTDKKLAGALADAVCRFDIKLVLVGFPDSELIHAGRKAGLRTVAEGFADRKYLPDGTLAPRSQPDALLTDDTEVAEQALRLAKAGKVETICVHGDGPHAARFARAARTRLEQAGIQLRSL
jgi:UPF0271 protein